MPIFYYYTADVNSDRFAESCGKVFIEVTKLVIHRGAVDTEVNNQIRYLG